MKTATKLGIVMFRAAMMLAAIMLATTMLATDLGLVSNVSAQSPAPPTTPTPADIRVFDSQIYALQTIDFAENPTQGIVTFSIQLDATTTWTIAMERVTARSDGFKVLIDDGVQLRHVEAPPIHTWRGFVQEEPRRKVRATLRDGQLRATIFPATRSFSGTGFVECIAVQPASDLDIDAESSTHVVFSADAVSIPAGSCATGLMTMQSAGLTQMNIVEGMHVCELALDADYEFYEANDSDVDDTVLDLEGVLNGVIEIFEDQLEITFEVTTIVIRTFEDDPYTETDVYDRLDEFEITWEDGDEANIHRDLAHLFTGEELDSGFVGLSATGAICEDFHYGLSQSTFTDVLATRIALTAHELGHGFNATHCSGTSCQIMCAVIDGCSDVISGFADEAVDDMVSYRDSSDCLTVLDGPRSIPFEDEFDEDEIDEEYWIHIRGAEIVGEYLELNAGGGGAHEDDEVRSNQILLGSVDAAYLEYSYRHRGVEEGETFRVEYLNSELEWELLEEKESLGENLYAFVASAILLPANALHDQFRIRFSVDVDEAGDRWQIDRVLVDELTDAPPSLSRVEPAVGPVDGGNDITIRGTSFLPGIEVYIDDVQVFDVVRVSEEELRVEVPGTTSEAVVDVEVSQLSGSSTILDGYEYAQNYLLCESRTARAGQEIELEILATHDFDLLAFSMGVDFPREDIEVLDVTVDGTAAEDVPLVVTSLNNELGPDGGWWTISIATDLDAPFDDVLPAAENSAIVRVSYELTDDVEAGTMIDLSFTANAGSSNVDVRFLGNGEFVDPPTVAGFVTVFADDTQFVRGDTNMSGTLQLIDALLILDALFSDGLLFCDDAADVTDNGEVSLIDVLTLLAYLFNDGEEPADPFPSPGLDTTVDDLGCG